VERLYDRMCDEVHKLKHGCIEDQFAQLGYTGPSVEEINEEILRRQKEINHI